eukprot:9484043-Pyramimonas_sp.AAC.1
MEVGGKTPDMEVGSVKKRKRHEAEYEPVTFHSMLDIIPAELLHSYLMALPIRLSPTGSSLLLRVVIL